ncbi:MAG TPA: hypothetical protein VN222_02845 [Novosphingobium sp.]|nr:hypothetical protein [Novosphingobium sp.]
MFRCPPFLTRLMDHRALSTPAQLRLGPEDKEAYAFANELRALTLEGRLAAVWTHPANELAGMVRKAANGKVVVPPQIAVARALGLITGTSDFLFMWHDGACAIEFKSKTGTMTSGQRDFRDWCAMARVPFHLVRSVEAGLSVLRHAGVLL